MQRVERELDLQGLVSCAPSLERLRIFSSAYRYAMDTLPSYRPLLLAVQREYDGLIESLHEQAQAVAPLEGRLKTLKAESVSLVGESTTRFQQENSVLRSKIKALEEETSHLKEAKQVLEDDAKQLKEAAGIAAKFKEEYHKQNFDIVKNFQRVQQQLEDSRKKEMLFQAECNRHTTELKAQDQQIRILEKNLQQESNKHTTMVAKDVYDGVVDRLNLSEQKFNDLDEKYKAVRRDYESTVRLYSELAGQKLEMDPSEIRPLTPRPTWSHCNGLADPDQKHSYEKADILQDLMQHILLRARTLLCAYGLWGASQKSLVVKQHSTHPLLIMGNAGGEQDSKAEKVKIGEGGAEEEPKASEEEPKEEKTEEADEHGDDEWFEPDQSLNTPPVLRHLERVRDLKLSRARTAEFINGIIKLRLKRPDRETPKAWLEFMLEHLPEHMKEIEKQQFALSINSAVRRYSAEPDFLAFQLLIQGKLTDHVVQDCQNLCSELLKSFRSFDQNGAKHITKQNFFYALQGLLPNKQKRMWQDLQHYFPAGGPDFNVNYEWLLMDDLYVPSPVIFGLRMQHLEETLELYEKLDKSIRSISKDGKVRYGEVSEQLGTDNAFYAIQDEDLARGFAVSPQEAKTDSVQDTETFLKLLKNGNIFPAIYKEAQEGAGGEAAPAPPQPQQVHAEAT
jgi:hypothetical protein